MTDATDTTDTTDPDSSRSDAQDSSRSDAPATVDGDAAGHTRRDGDAAGHTRHGATGHARRADVPRTDVETAVPPDVESFDCERCGRPFESERNLALHRGLAHEGDLAEAEREAFVESYEAESKELDRFRIVALGALVLLYFGLLFAYAVFA